MNTSFVRLCNLDCINKGINYVRGSEIYGVLRESIKTMVHMNTSFGRLLQSESRLH